MAVEHAEAEPSADASISKQLKRAFATAVLLSGSTAFGALMLLDNLAIATWLKAVCAAAGVSALSALAFGRLWGVAVEARLREAGEHRQRERRSMADLRRALDEHALFSIANAAGRIIEVNDKFCAVSGYRREELLGQDHRIVNSGYHGADYLRDLWRTIAGGQVWRGEFRNRRKDGGIYWVRSTIVPCLDAAGRPYQYIAIRTEVTELKQLQAQEAGLRERMQRLLDVSPTVIYAHENPDDLARCTFITANLARFIGTSADEALADAGFWRNRLHPDDQGKAFATLEQLRTRGESEVEYRFRKPSGEYVWIRDLAKAVRDGEGHIVAIVGSWADITAARQQEEELLRLRLAVEASEDMVIQTDKEGCIEYANPSFSRITGYSPHDVIGRNLLALSSDKGSAEAPSALWKTLRRGETWRGRLLNRRKGPPALAVAGQTPPPDPRNYWAEVSIAPIRGGDGATLGYVSIQRDISAQVAEEERLGMEQEDTAARLRIANQLNAAEPLKARCEAVLESLFALRGLGVQQKGGIFLRDSGADALEMFALRGSFSDEFIRREQRVLAGECLCGRAAVSGELLVSDDCFCDPRHERHFESMANHGHYIVPLVGDREVLGVLFLYTDPYPSHETARLTGLRQVGEMLGLAVLQARAAEALQQARDEAYESSRLKSEFLANMSHEIRTPMNGVLGMLDLLAGTPLNAEQREFAETAHNSAEALLSVINDILDFSKIEAGRLHLETIDFDLRRVVEEVCALLAGHAHGKRLELNCFVAPDLPGKVRGDPTRLRQVLVNLIGNAVKFTEEGEVSVEVLCLSEDDAQARFRIEVRDTGIGIGPETRSRLFNPFTQADGATTRRFGGTGLGLSISKELVELMGGEIGAESALGQGSVFWFTVALGKQPAGQPSGKADDLAWRRILVVDDNATNRRILGCFLRSWGATPDLADHGSAALAMVLAAQRAGQPYDLAILDLRMPDLDGLALSRLISREPALKALPRLLLSSSGPTDESECRAAGIAKVLSKPVRQSYLHDAIVALLHQTSPPSAPAEPEALSLPGYLGARVLLVEDNLINQKVATKMLDRFGITPIVARDGHEALAALESGRYDLALMDCQMPGMDGYAATRAWRARERERGLPRLPIVALTAHALQGDRELSLAAGMDDHLSKPFTKEELDAMLRRWLWRGVAADAAPKEPAPATPAGEAWDRKRVLENLEGDRELLEEMLRVFVKEAVPEQLGRLAEARVRQDAEAISLAAHTMRGMAGNFFATDMRQLAERLETAARRGDMAQAESLAAELDRATRRLCADIAADSGFDRTP
jgi:PAS domain S-box-containing protein